MSDPVPLVLLNAVDVEPEITRVAPEKRIAGDPEQRTWVQYVDPTGRFYVGLWASEPGSWRVSYTEEEHCRILEGVSVLTGADGIARTVQAGDSFVVPRGFKGTWEVVVPTRKVFVLYESGVPLTEES